MIVVTDFEMVLADKVEIIGSPIELCEYRRNVLFWYYLLLVFCQS
jgi:hypothetical protein